MIKRLFSSLFIAILLVLSISNTSIFAEGENNEQPELRELSVLVTYEVEEDFAAYPNAKPIPEEGRPLEGEFAQDFLSLIVTGDSFKAVVAPGFASADIRL